MVEWRGPVVAADDDRAVESDAPRDTDRCGLSREWNTVLQSDGEGVHAEGSTGKSHFWENREECRKMIAKYEMSEMLRKATMDEVTGLLKCKETKISQKAKIRFARLSKILS